MEYELKRELPDGGPTTPVRLAIVVARLNSRIRNRSLSAKEIMFQRDQATGEQLNICDTTLAQKQLLVSQKNHMPSAISKAHGGPWAKNALVQVGSLIYVKSDGGKHKARERYIVTKIHPDHVLAKKLTGSQFRSKEYFLKYTDIYPVPGSYLDVQNPFPNQNIDPYDSYSSDDDDDNIPVRFDPDVDPLEFSDDHSDANEVDSLNIDLPKVSIPDNNGDDMCELNVPRVPTDISNQGQVDSLSITSQGSQTRRRRPPKWMEEDIWDISLNKKK